MDLFTLKEGHGLRPGLPRIIGSDAAGIAFALGHGVTGIEVGGRYAIDPGISRFTDEYTRRGLDSVSPGYAIMGENTPGTPASTPWFRPPTCWFCRTPSHSSPRRQPR
jgi:threonine dehydrogenase-like Zn-dependent dehydrogenase